VPLNQALIPPALNRKMVSGRPCNLTALTEMPISVGIYITVINIFSAKVQSDLPVGNLVAAGCLGCWGSLCTYINLPNVYIGRI
jgi:hypothetical protein